MLFKSLSTSDYNDSSDKEGSSTEVDKGRNQLFCPIRKIWVAATPEEMVRQSLIQMMTKDLGFPIGGIALEKGLNQMPHVELNKGPIPTRRADIIVFAKDIHPQYPYYPLLLIECKAVPLTEKVIRQVVGYNQFVKARFIAVANQTEIRLGWFQPELQDYHFIPGLLPFDTLRGKVPGVRSRESE